MGRQASSQPPLRQAGLESSRLRTAATVAASIAAALAMAALLGWATDLELRRRLLPGGVAMNPVTALALLAAAAAVLLARRQSRSSAVGAARGIGCAIALLGAGKLLTYLTGAAISLDNWLFTDRLQENGWGINRMAPNTAWCLLLIGGALIALDRGRGRRWQPTAAMALLALISALFAASGYLYGTRSLYGLGGQIPMALNTAIAFIALASALLLIRPRRGLVGVLASRAESARIARRLAFAAVTIPLGLGWLRLQAQRQGLIGLETGVALFALLVTILFVAVVWWSTVMQRRSEVGRHRSALEASRAQRTLSANVVQLERRTRELATLARYGELLQACVVPGEVLSLARRAVGELLPGVEGAVVYRRSGDSLEGLAAWGSGVAAGAPAAADCWALRLGHKHRSEAELRCGHSAATGTTLCLPLMTQGEAIGLLSLHLGTGAADSSLEPLALALAEAVAWALGNLSLRDELRAQAIRDALTGLYNRRFLDEALPRELARAARDGAAVGVLMIDIDHFKRFNDEHGHAAGDAALRAVAARLQATARTGDLVCRYGGEELCVVMPGASAAGAAIHAERLRGAIGQLVVGDRGATVTLSIGVAAAPEHGLSADGLLHAADEALYAAKTEGRDRVAVAEMPQRAARAAIATNPIRMGAPRLPVLLPRLRDDSAA